MYAVFAYAVFAFLTSWAVIGGRGFAQSANDFKEDLENMHQMLFNGALHILEASDPVTKETCIPLRDLDSSNCCRAFGTQFTDFRFGGFSVSVVECLHYKSTQPGPVSNILTDEAEFDMAHLS